MGKRGRKVAQVIAAALYNAHLPGFLTGSLYKGPMKTACVPGLNCYSCPGAVAACPLGSLQAALGGGPKSFPWYALGLLILFGALLGRMVCGFFCPFGLIQELLYKIPGKKIPKGRWSRRLSKLKYAVLAVFVVIIPLWMAAPGFCKWICPAGTLEGGILLPLYTPALRELFGGAYWWKVSLLTAILGLCAVCFRAFCRFVCPLGAFYGFFNRVAVLGIRRDESRCSHCGACARACKMDVKIVNDAECVRCGECRSVCPAGAICFSRRPAKETETIGRRKI